MEESFLHYIWRNRLAEDVLYLSDETQAELVHPGLPNVDSGPDFFNTRVRIQDTEWAGNAEIHVQASDWEKHGHHKDPAYNNVILHLVWHADKQVCFEDGRIVPTVELKFDQQLYQNYQELLQKEHWVPCEEMLPRTDADSFRMMRYALAIERMESKSKEMGRRLQENKSDWEETFFQLMVRYFGLKVNADPFELLAKKTPLRTLLRHRDNPFQLEALLFGQSGLLGNAPPDDYVLALQQEYMFLRQKFELDPIDAHLWKFMRLRPANFPTIRISQLASLIHHTGALFAQIIEADRLLEIQTLFQVQAGDYWTQHYVFGKPTSHKPKRAGVLFADGLIVNAVIPALFMYGRLHNAQHYMDKALEWIEQLPPENNSIVERWSNLGLNACSALDSQALIQLRQEYCNKKRCLHCAIGNRLITGKYQTLVL